MYFTIFSFLSFSRRLFVTYMCEEKRPRTQFYYLRHRFSVIRKLIKRFCNYACCPISLVFKRTDLRFPRNKEIRILLWCMDLNETLYHIAHPLRCLVLLSLFFFSFSFAEVQQFLIVKEKKNASRVITFRQERIVSKYSWTSLVYNGHLGDRRKWPF